MNSQKWIEAFLHPRSRGFLVLEAGALDVQNKVGEFVHLSVLWKCSASNCIIGARDHASVQVNVAQVDKVTGKLNGQFKNYAICGAIKNYAICQSPSSDWPKPMASFQRTSDS